MKKDDFDSELPDFVNGRSNFQELQLYLADVLCFGQQLEAVLRNPDADLHALLIAQNTQPGVVELANALTTAIQAYAEMN